MIENFKVDAINETMLKKNQIGAKIIIVLTCAVNIAHTVTFIDPIDFTTLSSHVFCN